jgi:hypothetical protein
MILRAAAFGAYREERSPGLFPVASAPPWGALPAARPSRLRNGRSTG